MYYRINGYWKDDLSKFEGDLVRAFDDEPSQDDEYTDDDIFYYGLSEEEIKQSIESGENDSLEFVITSYHKA